MIIGKCPDCNSKNYTRDSPDFIDDVIVVRSHCHNCDCEFDETFELTTIERVRK